MNPTLKAHFLRLYAMVLSDFEVHPNELAVLYRIARDHYGLSEEEINKDVLSDGSMLYTPESPQEKIQYLYELALVVVADDNVAPAELRLMKENARLLGFSEDKIDKIISFLIEKAKENIPVSEILKQATYA